MFIKKFILPLCFLILLTTPTTTITYRRAIFGITLTGLCIAAIYGITRKICKPKKFRPSEKNLHIHIFEPAQLITRNQNLADCIEFDQLIDKVHRGKKLHQTELAITDRNKMVHKTVAIHRKIDVLEEHATFFIASRGYAKSNVPSVGDYLELTRDAGAIIEGHMLIKDNLIHNAPCVTFDYPDDPPYFNFGQKLDVSCLETVWKRVTHKNKNASIVAIGDCRGGKALLNFATKKPENLKAMVLMSPFISDKDLIDQIARNHIQWLPWSKHILFNFFKFYFPSFDPNQDDLMQKIHKIDPALPIFIGHRKNDFLVSDASIRTLLEILRKAGNKDLYLLVVSDDNATHSRISPIPELQYAANAFLAAYNLPHDLTLAQRGETLLAQAKMAAQIF